MPDRENTIDPATSDTATLSGADLAVHVFGVEFDSMEDAYEAASAPAKGLAAEDASEVEFVGPTLDTGRAAGAPVESNGPP